MANGAPMIWPIVWRGLRSTDPGRPSASPAAAGARKAAGVMSALEADRPRGRVEGLSTSLAVVDFPQPDSPTRPSVSPADGEAHVLDCVHPRTARENKPFVTGKRFVRCSTSTSGSPPRATPGPPPPAPRSVSRRPRDAQPPVPPRAAACRRRRDGRLQGGRRRDRGTPAAPCRSGRSGAGSVDETDSRAGRR